MSDYKATSKGLYKDGKLVKLEYGHEEQIKAVRKYEKMKEALSGDGLLLEDIEVEARLSFECICGRSVSVEATLDKDNMDLEAFTYKRAKCYSCDTPYMFSTDECGELVVNISIREEALND